MDTSTRRYQFFDGNLIISFNRSIKLLTAVYTAANIIINSDFGFLFR